MLQTVAVIFDPSTPTGAQGSEARGAAAAAAGTPRAFEYEIAGLWLLALIPPGITESDTAVQQRGSFKILSNQQGELP